jgi:acetolactate synthase-1/3 small subunit
MNNKFIIAVLVSNLSGVLSRVSGMFTRRGFNIDSLTVGETESSSFSRITIAFHGDDHIKDQIIGQLRKLHDVKEVQVMDNTDTVIRELLLIKVRNTPESRQDVMTAVEIFRSKIVDYSPTALCCEITGEASKINAFIELLKPYGILEMCRTGLVALERGENCLNNK